METKEQPECAPVVLVVDDEQHIRLSIEKALKKEGYEVLSADNGDAGLEVMRRQEVNLVISDLRMPKTDGIAFLKMAKTIRPEIEVIMMTGYGTISTAITAIRLGAYDFIEKPFKRAQLLKTVRQALEKQRLIFENRRLRQQIDGGAALRDSVIGQSDAMRAVLNVVGQVADSQATILITGESGTGKEVIANSIHAQSRRRSAPIVKVSCAALPETLLEAELFGYEKGAFTGATSRKAGRFELADGGTLLLDEVGEIPASMQVKLLRVIQEGEFERLGGTETQHVDVRLVAATNQDLEELVEEGRFRKDLYYRLNVINIRIPPLRDRREDIPLLVAYFIDRYAARNRRSAMGITQPAMDALLDHSWPGNVRELENAIERAIVLTRGDMIDVDVLPSTIGRESGAPGHLVIPVGTTLRDAESRMIDATLRQTGGNREMAARVLGIASRTIYRRLRDRQLMRQGHDGHGVGGIEKSTHVS